MVEGPGDLSLSGHGEGTNLAANLICPVYSESKRFTAKLGLLCHTLEPQTDLSQGHRPCLTLVPELTLSKDHPWLGCKTSPDRDPTGILASDRGCGRH